MGFMAVCAIRMSSPPWGRCVPSPPPTGASSTRRRRHGVRRTTGTHRPLSSAPACTSPASRGDFTKLWLKPIGVTGSHGEQIGVYVAYEIPAPRISAQIGQQGPVVYNDNCNNTIENHHYLRVGELPTPPPVPPAHLLKVAAAHHRQVGASPHATVKAQSPTIHWDPQAPVGANPRSPCREDSPGDDARKTFKLRWATGVTT